MVQYVQLSTLGLVSLFLPPRGEIIDRKLLDQDTSDKQGPGLNGLNLGADS